MHVKLSLHYGTVARCFGSCSTAYASQAHNSYGFQKTARIFSEASPCGLMDHTGTYTHTNTQYTHAHTSPAHMHTHTHTNTDD